MIRNAGIADIEKLVECIRISFRDVAEQFGLNAQNCPTHPSLCQNVWIRKAMEKDVQFYCLEENDRIIGCAALEKVKDDIGYLERLAVRPEFRRQSYGSQLVHHILEEGRKIGLSRISIAIIALDTDLARWYEQRGFRKIRYEEFPHLPLGVQFMEIRI